MDINDEIDEVIEKIDEIEQERNAGKQDVDLDELRDKLRELKTRARDLERAKEFANEKLSEVEFANEEIEEKQEALEALYQKAVYVLGKYGIDERELHYIYGYESLDELMRKFGQQPAVRAIRSAIVAGRVEGHQSCAYAGRCLDYDVGLADKPCAAAAPTGTKGRFGAMPGGKGVHAQCRDSCFPHSLGWCSEEERCK